MTSRNASRDDFDRLMRQWLDADARVGEPDHLLEQVLTQTRRSRRFPRWVLPEWWLPMQLTMPMRAVPRLAPLLLLIALLLAATIAIVWIGSRPRLPDPFGPAANGQVAYLSNGQIFAANPDGSSPIQLTVGDGSASSPVWSRDGTKLAFRLTGPTSDPSNMSDSDLVVVNADGTNPITIDGGQDISPPNWSPDGQWLVYSRMVGPRNDQAFMAAADGSSPPARIGNPETVNWSPIFSPDGTKILYFSGWDGDGIGVMNPDGSDWHILNTTPFEGIDSATWHPDGNRIVVSAHTGEGMDLWILYVDDSAEQHLGLPGRDEAGPSWSPAGDRLAYLTSGDGESFLLHVADADGANERPLPGTYSHINPSWSPDGTRIGVVNDFGSVVRLTLLDPDGRAEAIVIEGDLPAEPVAERVSPTAWQRVAP
jgi:dipeptidyl aminopeptidase/acylaminoacyl peptidase